MREYFEAAAYRAAFGIVGTVDHSRDAGLNDGTCAHRTRLDGDIERGAHQPVIFGSASGFAERDDLRVGGRVTIPDGAVISASQNLPILYQDRADRHLIRLTGGGRLVQGQLHEIRIVHDGLLLL